MGARLVLGVVLGMLTCAASAEPTTITVLPFTAEGGERRTWLGKGIADILTRNLAEIERFIVVDQSRLQIYLDEMELKASAFTTPGQAMRVARVARVDEIMFGTFDVDDGELKLSAAVIALDTQDVVQRIEAAGGLDHLHAFLAEVTFQFAAGKGLVLAADARRKIKSRPTDSLPATEQFYRAMEAQDRGEYEEAASRFIGAAVTDPNYREAHLWVGRMFEFLNLKPLSIAAYEGVYGRHFNSTEGRDAVLFSAMIAMDTERAETIGKLERLAGSLPPTAHSVEAAFLLGELLETGGAGRRAYDAYGKVIDFHDRFEDARQRNKERQSRFFSWNHVLGRYREASVRRISMYPELNAGTPDDAPLEPPRGAIIVDGASPSFFEKKYGHARPLFMNEEPLPNWTERFYAVIAPRGQVISGIDLKVRGQLTERSSTYDFTMRVSPFPIPRNYHNSWLGVIYGQTVKATELEKFVPFYGRHQRIVTLQFIENHGRIFDWGFELRLRDDEPSAAVAPGDLVVAGGFQEGQVIGRVPLDEAAFSGVAKPLAAHWYEPRQTLALVNNHTRGLYLVVVKGELDSGQTDLWLTQSFDGRHWLPLTRLPVNSLSDDFSPRLLRAEDGSLRLFWISNRRGLGWELWTSRLDPQTQAWIPARRIPLERVDGGGDRAGVRPTELLHYGVTQDRRGRWLVAVRSVAQKKLLVLTSTDGDNWRIAGGVQADFAIYNPAIVEDDGGVYRILAFAGTTKLHLWSSNDLTRWRAAAFEVNRYGNDGMIAPHPIQLFRGKGPKLVALISDTNFGLQYAVFHPDAEKPAFDLVRGIGLEAYAAERFEDGFIVAQRRNDAVDIRRYRTFQSHGGRGRPPRGIIYSEFAADAHGNEWRRIFARMRVIQPDVTTVGVGLDERVWWGIESGAMTLKEGDFFAVDVADGFFHHHVTTIEPCGAVTAFSSIDLNRPRIGLARRSGDRYEFSKHDFAEANGRVTALVCIGDLRFAVGTSGGDVLAVAGGRPRLVHRFDDTGVTALAPGTAPGEILIGTASGRLFRYDGELEALPVPGVAAGAIEALAVDASGRIWLAIDEQGVYVGRGEDWRALATDSTGVYRNVGVIRPDPDRGVWMIAGADEASRGVLYSDGSEHLMLSPPDGALRAPTGLAVSPSGAVWIGTAFDGLFQLTRADR